MSNPTDHQSQERPKTMFWQNLFPGLSVIGAMGAAFVAWQAVDRTDIASITNLQRDLKELEKKHTELARKYTELEAKHVAQENLLKPEGQIGQKLSQMADRLEAVEASAKRHTMIITQANFDSYNSSPDKLLMYAKERCDRKDKCNIDTNIKELTDIDPVFMKLTLTYFCANEKMPPKSEFRGAIMTVSCPSAP
jgi:hypothetical protein